MLREEFRRYLDMRAQANIDASQFQTQLSLESLNLFTASNIEISQG